MATLPAIDLAAAAGSNASRSRARQDLDATLRLFAEFQARVAQHEQALARCSGLEAALLAEHEYPRVRLPALAGKPARYAAEAITITGTVPLGPQRRRLLRILRQRQERWDVAAHACGLRQTQKREDALFQAVRAAADTLYAMPATSLAGVGLKLVVQVSLEEPGEGFRDTSPWRELGLILTDLSKFAACA